MNKRVKLSKKRNVTCQVQLEIDSTTETWQIEKQLREHILELQSKSGRIFNYDEVADVTNVEILSCEIVVGK